MLRWTLIGVFRSMSITCDHTMNPSQFGRVTEVKKWIEDKTEGTENSDCRN